MDWGIACYVAEEVLLMDTMKDLFAELDASWARKRLEEGGGHGPGLEKVEAEHGRG